MRALLKEHAEGNTKGGLHALHNGGGAEEEGEEEDEGPKTITDVLYGARTTIFMIMLFYHTPTMVKTFNFFRCVTVDEIDYLEMDLRIICWTPRHIGMCMFAGFVAILYGRLQAKCIFLGNTNYCSKNAIDGWVGYVL